MNPKFNQLMIMMIVNIGIVGVVKAQSSVTLYGRLNTSVEWQRANLESSNEFMMNDRLVSGAQTKTKLRPGVIQKSNEAYFGIMGNEDIGNGWKAQFKIETGFMGDTGGQDNTNLVSGFADRKAWLGLSNDSLGVLRLGFGGTSGDLSPFYQQFENNTINVNDNVGTSKILYGKNKNFLDINNGYWGATNNFDGTKLAAQNFSTTFSQASGQNNIAYFSPNWGGFSFGTRVAFWGTNDSIRSNNSDLGTGKETGLRLYDLALNYNKPNLINAGDEFYVGLGWQANQKGNLNGGLSSSEVSNRTQRVQLVSSYQFANHAKLSFVAGSGKDKWHAYNQTTDANNGVVSLSDLYRVANKMTYFQLGGSMPLTNKIDFRANYAWMSGKLSGTSYNEQLSSTNFALSNKTVYQQLQTSIAYSFSKKTQVYSFVDFLRARENTLFQEAASQFIKQNSRNKSSTLTFGIGLSHNF